MPTPPPQLDAFQPVGPDVTVREARAMIRAGWHEGTTCPVCDGFVKLYRRRITSSISAVLVALLATESIGPRHRPPYVRADGFVHLGKMMAARGFPSSIARAGDFGTLRYWGLVERAPGKRPDGARSNGWWRLTSDGRAFASGALRVPREKYVYNDRVRDPRAACVPLADYSDHAGNRVTVSIHDTLRARFDYAALMQSFGPVDGDARSAA